MNNKKKRKLTPREKIYHIFAHRFKHLDTEEEEKGVSLRELASILYQKRITVEQMIIGEENDAIFFSRRLANPSEC